MKLFRTLFVAGLVRSPPSPPPTPNRAWTRSSPPACSFGTEGTYAPFTFTRHRASWSASTWTSAAPSRSAWA